MTNTRRFRPLSALLCLLLLACGGGDRPGGLDPEVGSTPPPGANPPPPLPPGPAPGNSPPQISGTPSTSATVGEQWTFQPTVADPDGDIVIVTAANLPAWMALSPDTGRLQGTPAESDVRTWDKIQLTASDGRATTALGAFSVTVVAAGASTGTATLSWNPPTERTDGTPIGGLAGYEVLYGRGPRNYDTVVELASPGLTRYVVEDLRPGMWYFAVKAVTTDGLKSAPSVEVRKRVCARPSGPGQAC